MESKIKISNLQFICTVTVLVLGALISLFLATHDIFLLFISLLNLKRQTFWWVWNIIFLLFSALTIRHIKLDWLFCLDNFGHYSSFQHRKFSILKDYNIFYLLCRRRKPNILKIYFFAFSLGATNLLWVLEPVENDALSADTHLS